MDEESAQRPLTPNILIRGEPTRFLEETNEVIESKGDILRRMCHLKLSKDQLMKIWVNEYLKAFHSNEYLKAKPKNKENLVTIEEV